MARPLARCSPCQNSPPTDKDKPAGPAPIESSDSYTPAPAISRAPTPAPPAAPALSPSAVNSMVKYLEANLQRIFRTVLETTPPAPALQPRVFPDGPCERPLKPRFPELYCGKTHIECYNFIQLYKDHFTTIKAKEPNRVPFVVTFLWERALFCWQQQKAKNVGETNVPVIWEEFKSFLCQSLGKSRAFVDSIWKTIRRSS